MTRRRRRPIKMHRSASIRLKQRPSAVNWIIRLVIGAIMIGVVAWVAVSWVRLQARVAPVGDSSSHAFITTTAANPVLLVIRQGNQPASIDSLQVVRVDRAHHSLTILPLPTNLSDGQTSVGQYLESGYYKELQQAVEQALALPIDGYLLETRQAVAGHSRTWSSLVSATSAPTWYQTSIGLPQWLNQLPILRTNLSATQTLQLVWAIRDLSSRMTIGSLPTNTLKPINGGVTLDPSVSDDLVGQLFTSKEAKDQGVTVVIKNGTDTSGLATLLGRYVTHLGGEVVAVEPSDSGQNRSSMSAASDSLLTNALTQFLGVPLTKSPPTGRERADLEIILGQDVLSRLGVN